MTIRCKSDKITLDKNEKGDAKLASLTKKIYKLEPALMANIWGGNKLRDYGKISAEDRIGESWELSFVRGSEAQAGGVKTTELFDKSVWGEKAQKFGFFPVLTKFIDAKEKLSVQVHPNDEYALEHEGQYGKSEMWYVVSADTGAGLYMGFNRNYSKNEIERAIAEGTVESMLSFKEVKAGDVFFIPAGTVHAIGGGVLIYEIQQNSTLTYRLYDYMRRDTQGNLRELHIEKAMKVLNTGVYQPFSTERISDDGGKIIGECEYFITKEYSSSEKNIFITVDNQSFKALSAVRGEGKIILGKEEYPFAKGESYFIPAQESPVSIAVSGDVTFISIEV